MTDQISDYYAAYKLLTRDGKQTDLHTTVLFRHDTTHDELEKIKDALTNLNLHGTHVKILKYEYLDGPNGEKDMIKTCLLDMNSKDKLEKLEKICKDFTFRKYLKEQHKFTFHTSVGSTDQNNVKKYKEYVDNQKTIDDNIKNEDDYFILSGLYLKNMNTKEVIYF